MLLAIQFLGEGCHGWSAGPYHAGPGAVLYDGVVGETEERLQPNEGPWRIHKVITILIF